MTTLSDEIIRVTGGPTVNDGLASYFSKTANESLQDAESRWLLSQIEVTALASIDDMWRQFLGGSGNVNDLKFDYWKTHL